jgi:hypothetical protein
MTHIVPENSCHTTEQPAHPFAESNMFASEDAISSSKPRLVSIESSDTFYMDSAEELRLMDGDVMEPIPLLGITSDTSSENARKSFGLSSGANTRPIGTHNNDIQERLPFPLKSDCTLDEMEIPADDEDPRKTFRSSLKWDCGPGSVFSTAESTSQMKDRTFHDMLKILFDSQCSIGTRIKEEKATELDQSRLESDSNSKRGAASVDVSEGAGTMDTDKRGAASVGVAEGARTVVPTVNDVLGGKGGKTVDHNLHYTRLCAAAADEYVATKKRGWSGKKGIALKVVEDVQKLGGRFLTPSSTCKGWNVVSEEASIDKAAHCIRDVIHRRTKRRRLGE